MNKKVIKRRKIKRKAILISFIFIILISLSIYYLYNIKITNIYIIDNEILSDYEIIKIAKLQDYPNSMDNSSTKIKKRLESNEFIKSAKVVKKELFTEVYIYVEENIPLFYYQLINKVILKDGKKANGNYLIPVVTNEISPEVYDEFIDCMGLLNKDILIRISEIKYDPNDIDNERFYLTMNDGNYVYLNLNKFVKTFNNKKGILYLDSGEYFEIFDENIQ